MTKDTKGSTKLNRRQQRAVETLLDAYRSRWTGRIAIDLRDGRPVGGEQKRGLDFGTGGQKRLDGNNSGR